MGFVEAISSGFRNDVGFSGRAARSEYWYWTLFVVLRVELDGQGAVIIVRFARPATIIGWWLLILRSCGSAVGIVVCASDRLHEQRTNPARFLLA